MCRAYPDAAMLTPGCAAVLSASALAWLQPPCMQPLVALLAAAHGCDGTAHAQAAPLDCAQRTAAAAAAAFAAGLQLLTAAAGLPGVVRHPAVRQDCKVHASLGFETEKYNGFTFCLFTD